MTTMVTVKCSVCKKTVVRNKSKHDYCKKRNPDYMFVCPECKEKKRNNSIAVVNCDVCGEAIIRTKKYFDDNWKRNPDYRPTCSMECRAQQNLLKKREKNGSQDQLLNGNGEQKRRIAKSHKGQQSAEQWNYRNNLVKKGKASKYSPYRNSVEEALIAAGL